jgi:acyl transferase domain-containing protein
MSDNKETASLIKESLTQIKRLKKELAKQDEPIAMIGMGCRFPGGANTPEAFWNLLDHATDAMSEVPVSRWDADSFYDPDPKVPGKMITKLAGFLDGDIAAFDASFFGISPREAEYMDPQHRLLLEVCYQALENAGIAPTTLEGSLTGVFIGLCNHDYMDLITATGNKDLINPYMATGNAANAAAGRLSFFFGLQGPNLAIDTACSSSLVAIDEACRNLRSNEANLAIAGGVNLILSPDLSINFSKAGMLAPDGHCKTFDASADGYARGEGCGIIILKRLSDAIHDKNPILAVIRASGVNQGGATSGLTVPNGNAQEILIRKVLTKAKLKGADIDYIEAHGTGTSLGDPIEMRAIGATYGEREGTNPLKIGSVKTNFGHLEGAAGIAGVIKTVLAMQHEFIPAHLHFKKMNPLIDMNFPGEIVIKKQPWNAGGRVRRAAVSSFGFSGTNSHLIIEEAPKIELVTSSIPERSSHILTLSAKTENALAAILESYRKFLVRTKFSLGDICYTANTGRNHERFRLAVMAKDLADLQAKLTNGDFLKGEAETTKKADIKSPEEMVAAYVKGADIDWKAHDASYVRHIVDIPNYPFQRKRFWVEFSKVSKYIVPTQEQLNRILTAIREGNLSVDEFVSKVNLN